MRILVLIITALFVFSCERENVPGAVTAFPTVLVFDSWETLSTEVFDKEGRLTEYDEAFDEFEFMTFWAFDSIVLVNRTLSVTYRNLILPLTFKVDTFRTEIHESYFNTVPIRIPQSIKVIDTRSAGNERTVNHPEEIGSILLWTYNKTENEFRVPLTAIRVFTTIEGGYNLYNMIGQSCANSVDKETLYKNLETNETLSLIHYELTFRVK